MEIMIGFIFSIALIIVLRVIGKKVILEKIRLEYTEAIKKHDEENAIINGRYYFFFANKSRNKELQLSDIKQIDSMIMKDLKYGRTKNA